MVKGLDELVDFAVERIALCGIQGANAYEVKTIVHDFYDSPEPRGGDAGPEQAPNVDDRFCGKVWSWLCKHKDIRVRVRDVAVSPGDVPAGSNGSAAHGEEKEHYLTVKSTRMWHTLAGHAPDPKRIPPLSFVVLSIIASHGTAGVLQPEITRISGQDKRSVPKRTDELARSGYIEKRTVLAKGTHKTSLCTLTRFVEKKADADGEEEPTNPADLLELAFKDSVVRHEAFIQSAIPLIKTAQVITLNDLKRHYNILGRRWESRVLSDFILRMEVMGLVEKLRAKIDGFEDTKHTLRSIQFVREPTAAEIQTFCALGRLDSPARREKFETALSNEAAGVVADERDDDDTFDGEPDEDQRQEILGDLAQRSESAQSIDWNPMLTVNQNIHNVIESAGATGLSTMALIDRLGGPFYRRPIEHMTAQMTDSWEAAQPGYLRHLCIIRDVGQSARYTYYIYRTLQNFDEATKLGHTTWEAVKPSAEDEVAKQTSKWVKNMPLDQWGFPKIRQDLLLEDGFATAADARRAVKVIRQPVRILGDMASFGHSGKGRIQRAEGTPTGTRQVLKSIVKKTPDTKFAGTPARRRGKPTKATSNRLSELRATSPDESSLVGASPKKTPSQESSVAKRRGRPPRATKVPEESVATPARESYSASQDINEDPTTPIQYLTELDEIQTENSLQPRGIPSRRLALFTEQMQNVADRVARIQLGIPINQPLASRQDDGKFLDTSRETTNATSAVVPERPAAPRVLNSNNKRALSPSVAEGSPKRLRLDEQYPEPISGATLKAYRKHVKILTQQLLDLQRPGVYINPPQYLAWKRGRPRSSALVVFKSDKLLSLPWFKPSQEITSEIYQGPGVDRRTRKIDRQIRDGVVDHDDSGDNSRPADPVLNASDRPVNPDLVVADESDESNAITMRQPELANVRAKFGIPSTGPGPRRSIHQNSKLTATTIPLTPLRGNVTSEGEDVPASQTRSKHRTKSSRSETGDGLTFNLTAEQEFLNTQVSDGDDEVIEALADFSWIEVPRVVASTNLGRSISRLMSPRHNARKRRKLDRSDRQAEASTEDPSATEFGAPKNIVGASRMAIPVQPAGPRPPMVKAKQFIALIDPNLPIPHNPKFQGMERQQPYGCVKCGRRYRNPGGLEYHVDNSEPCYPDRYAETQEQKAQKIKTVQAQKKPTDEKVYEARFEPEELFVSEDEDEDEEEAVAPTDKEVTLNEDTISDPPFAPLIRGRASMSSTQPELIEDPSPVLRRIRKDHRAKTGTMLSGGSVMHRRYEIVLGLLKSYNGAIPGDRALHPVFITAWRNGGGAGSPDIDTVRRTINNLVSQLKIKRLVLAFSAAGASHNANILTFPDIRPDSEPVHETLKLFQDAFPRIPIPPGFEIAEDLKRGIQSYPGHSGLTGRAERYPANTEVTVKRLRQPLLPLPKTTSQAPAWASWAEKNKIPAKRGRGGTLFTRDDFLEATLNDIEDGVRFPSGHVKSQPKTRTGSDASPRKRQGRETMHTRIQRAKDERRKEIVDDLDDIAALEAEVTEEQAEMQSVFSLGGDYVPSRFEPGQIAVSGGRGRVGPRRPGGGIRWKPLFKDMGSATVPLSEDTIAREDLANDITEDDAPEMTMPLLRQAQRKSAGGLGFPVLKPAMAMVKSTVNPMGWVAGLRSMTRGRKSAVSVPSQPDNLPLLTTLTDPDQAFYNISGTFSTNFAVRRKLRPQMRISAPRQTDYEARMAAAFSDLESDLQETGKLLAGFHGIEDVERWESSHREDLTANMELIQTRWINHTVDPDVAVNVTWVGGSEIKSSLDQPIEIGGTESIRRSRRSKILRRPPVRPRKEPQPPQDAKTKGTDKRKSAKARQTRRDYSLEYGSDELSGMFEAGKRGPQTKRYLKKEQLERGLAAIVLAQVLAGGKYFTLDWRVVESALNDKEFDLKFLRHRWFTIRSQNSIRLADLRGKFQKAFLRAATKGEMDIPDFENAAEYDWNRLHRWTMDNVIMEHKVKANSTELDPLPATRSDFDQECLLADDEVYTIPEQDQYKPIVTIQRKEDLMTESEWIQPLHEHCPPTIDEVSLTAKAESWLRSNVLAKGHGYDARTSRALLEQLPGPVLDQALTTYLDRKWLRVLNKGRLGPGRNYVAHSDFSKLLRPEARDKDICQPGVSFKLSLDEQLAEHEQIVSSLHSRRGEGVTLLNLVANHRVEFEPILPPVTQDTTSTQIDPHTGTEQKCLSIFGLAPGNYVTKNLAKDEFYFDVCVRPTSAYVPGADSPAASAETMPPIPAPHLDPVTGRMSLARAVPIWYDLQGRLNADVWRQLLMCVVLELVCQTGKSSEVMARRYEGAVAPWEMECVLRWLDGVGIAKKIVRRDGSLGGWTTAEGWWYVFGAGSGDEDDEQGEDAAEDGDGPGEGIEDEDEDDVENGPGDGDGDGGHDDGDEQEDENEDANQPRGTLRRAKETLRVSFALPDDETTDEML